MRIKKNIWTIFGLMFFVLATIAFIFFRENNFNFSDKYFSVDSYLENNGEISPQDPLVFNFSRPIVSKNFGREIRINPVEEASFKWENNYKRLIIKPKKFWKPETNYSVFLPDGKGEYLTKFKGSKVIFSTPTLPKVKIFSPQNQAQDVILGVEDPIIVDFDKSTDNFFVNFVVDPKTTLIYQNNPEKTQFRLLPEKSLEPGREYLVKIYVKYANAGDENYTEIYSSSFRTFLPPPPKIKKITTTEERLAEAQKSTQPKIYDGKYIDVNLKQQIMSIFENGVLIDSFLISSGKRGMETPAGNFQVRNKYPRAWSKKYGLYMPFWMAILPNGSVGIHELPEWPGGYKEGKNHLGIPVSHGCIRLGVGPAEEVYDWTEVGTPVIIY